MALAIIVLAGAVYYGLHELADAVRALAHNTVPPKDTQ